MVTLSRWSLNTVKIYGPGGGGLKSGCLQQVKAGLTVFTLFVCGDKLSLLCYIFTVGSTLEFSGRCIPTV